MQPARNDTPRTIVRGVMTGERFVKPIKPLRVGIRDVEAAPKGDGRA